MTFLSGNWNYPTAMRVGAGRLRDLPAVLEEQRIRHALVVVDQGIKNLPFVTQALEHIRSSGRSCGLFADIKGNPTGTNVADGVAAYRDGGYGGVVALGGGSAIDAAKAIALMSGQDRPLWDFVDEGDNWKAAREAGIAGIVAIPTTAGTGSEVGRASVILDEEAREKKIIFHPRMMPGAVISDPELTTGLPPHITAATGIDAFTHCFEAFCAPGYHPMADGIALEGMRLIKDWLARAYRDGGNMEARTHMLVAASMGATAFQKGLGGVHAMSHPVGALYDAHHGLCNAVFLPYVMLRNRPGIEEKAKILARFLGLGEGGFSDLLHWVLQWREELGIPHTAETLGVRPGDLDLLSRAAVRDPSGGGNPVRLESGDYRDLFERSLTGDLSSP